ncbi:MAG: hypothetical protein H8E62_10715 [Planctomycetes bacterium]|nr:hypothetical protein [Planctomycetota bacterium]
MQLTDGKKDESYWVRQSTVGWSRPRNLIEITMDLGSIRSFDQVNLFSIGGGKAGVEYPEFIAVLTSTDNKTYQFASLADSRELVVGQNKKKSHTFTLNFKPVASRWIRIIVRPRGHFFFLDEIEVLWSDSTEPPNRVTPSQGPQYTDMNVFVKHLEEYRQLKRNMDGCRTALHNESLSLKADVYQQIDQQLIQLEKDIPIPTDRLYSDANLQEFDARVGSIRSTIYGDYYQSSFAAVSADPMQMLLEHELYLKNTVEPNQIELFLWQNEYEPAAVNLINASQSQMQLSVSVSPLQDTEGKTIDSSRLVNIRRAVYVQGSQVGSVADALVLQNDAPFKILPGELSQIWLTFHAADLPPGVYQASIAVSLKQDNETKLQTLPISIEIADRVFPEQASLNTIVWAYPNQIRTARKYPNETVRDLTAHYTNVLVVPPQDMPFPAKISEDSGIQAPLDFRHFDELMKQHDYARTYLFYLGFKRDGYRLKFGQWRTPAWERAFAQWLRAFTAHLKQLGLEDRDYAIYPFDERINKDFTWVAKLIKRTDPTIQVYANWFRGSQAEFKDAVDLVDIWCPQEDQVKAGDKLAKASEKTAGSVWAYLSSNLPPKARDPYSVYRLLPWRAFMKGLTGAGFWVYADPGGPHPWDDMLNAYGYYGVVYSAETAPAGVDTQGEKLIPSRRWEAWREGVEDFDYLTRCSKYSKGPALKELTEMLRDGDYRQFKKKATEATAREEARNN